MRKILDYDLSFINELTFVQTREYLAGYANRNHHAVLDIADCSDDYTSFELMLSDQCPWHINLTIDGCTRVFEGSLIVQASEAIEAIAENNPLIKIKNHNGMYRCYPTPSVAEGVYNSIIHFDTNFMANIEIEMGKDVLTITSPGGLFHPPKWTDFNTVCPRNEKMGLLLKELGLAKLSYNGIKTMESNYKGSRMRPRYSTEDYCFVLRLPSLIHSSDDKETVERRVCEYLASHRGPSVGDISDGMLFSMDFTKKTITAMEEKGLLFVLGGGSESMVFLCESGERIAQECKCMNKIRI